MQLLAAVFATLSASKSLPDLYDFSCNIQVSSQQPPSGYLSITRSASGGSARELRRQQAQGVPGACKKAGSVPTGAVCRSCTTWPVSTGASPSRRERRYAFPGSRTRRRHLAGRVPRAKRLGRQRRNPGSRNLYTVLIWIKTGLK